MRRLQGLSFLVLNFWGEGGEGEFFVYILFLMCSQYILKMFPSGFLTFPEIPNVFHKTFPRAPHVLCHIV